MILFTWLALHSFSPAGPCTTPCNGLDPGLRITTLHSAGAGRFKSHGVNQLLCYASDLRTSGLSLTCCLSPITQRLILSSAGVQVPVEDAGLPQGSTKTLPVPMGPVDSSLPQPPVLETGEAGPPGRMIPSKLPKGTDGSMKPVQGFAGAPGETHRHVPDLSSFPSLSLVSHLPVLLHSVPQQQVYWHTKVQHAPHLR